MNLPAHTARNRTRIYLILRNYVVFVFRLAYHIATSLPSIGRFVFAVLFVCLCRHLKRHPGSRKHWVRIDNYIFSPWIILNRRIEDGVLGLGWVVVGWWVKGVAWLAEFHARGRAWRDGVWHDYDTLITNWDFERRHRVWKSLLTFVWPC